jgi:tRNA 5-methylaminomethyl-2-thiouridine biosynthesis bifunctional protein
MSQGYRFPKLAECAHIEWDESGQPYSPRFDDIYFSKQHGLNESRYVFLDGNRLSERWSTAEPNTVFTIFETGFGTGLNFLAAWQAWEKSAASQSQHLHFISVEAHPLKYSDLKKAVALWPELKAYSELLLKHYPVQPGYSTQRLNLIGPEGSRITLTLIFEDVVEALQDFRPDFGSSLKYLIGEQKQHIDAWFLDGFAPSKNSDMWLNSVFSAMAKYSGIGTSFATFTCAGVVKRGLSSVGFECSKIPGYGRKREMLIGQWPSTAANETTFSEQGFYFKTLTPTDRHNTIAIIGAGLAGAQLAHRMAERGWRVNLVDEAEPASGASGNLQGVVYTRPSLQANPLNEFNLLAQQYADHFYTSQGFYEHCGQQCGLVHLAYNHTQRERLRAFYEAFSQHCDDIVWNSAEQNSLIAGLKCDFEGLMLKRSGFIYPKKLIAKLIDHPNITATTHSRVLALNYQSEQWHLSIDDENTISADVCVIANSNQAKNFIQTASFPSKAVRGQVSYGQSQALGLSSSQAVFCAEGYVAPACDFTQSRVNTFGASFKLNSQSCELRDEEHEQNLEHLRAMFHTDANMDAIVDGRANLRCTTPDYFPVVGPVPVDTEMRELLAPLASNAKSRLSEPGRYYPGLYCSFGYGSRGLSYSAICSELLADLICGAPLPMRWGLYRYLHPARFVLREIQRSIGSRGR